MKKKAYADEHRIGVAKGLDERVVAGLREHFTGECNEVGMYLAMSRQADRESYPEIVEAFKRCAFEEANHAACIVEMLGEVVTDSTEKTLKCVLQRNLAPVTAKSRLLRLPKSLVMTPCMTVFMKWPKMKPVMAEALTAC